MRSYRASDSERWHCLQSTTACSPSSGKPFSWWSAVMLSTIQCCVVWHLAQSSPTVIWCKSVWQEMQADCASSNTSVSWQLRQSTPLCCPVKGKSVCSWLKRLVLTGTPTRSSGTTKASRSHSSAMISHPAGEWQAAQSYFNAVPCGFCENRVVAKPTMKMVDIRLRMLFIYDKRRSQNFRTCTEPRCFH